MSFLGFSASNTLQSRTLYWRPVQFLRLRTFKHHLSTHASQTITTGGFSRADGMPETGFSNIAAGNYEKLACGNFFDYWFQYFSSQRLRLMVWHVSWSFVVQFIYFKRIPSSNRYLKKNDTLQLITKKNKSLCTACCGLSTVKGLLYSG